MKMKIRICCVLILGLCNFHHVSSEIDRFAGVDSNSNSVGENAIQDMTDQAGENTATSNGATSVDNFQSNDHVSSSTHLDGFGSLQESFHHDQDMYHYDCNKCLQTEGECTYFGCKCYKGYAGPEGYFNPYDVFWYADFCHTSSSGFCHTKCGSGVYHDAGKCLEHTGSCLCYWGWTGPNAHYITNGFLKKRILADYCTIPCFYNPFYVNRRCGRYDYRYDYRY